MPATERLALMIESRTRGNAEIERLTKALNTFVAAVEKSSRKTTAATAKANKHAAALKGAAANTDAATARVKKHGAALKGERANYAALTAAVIAYGVALKVLAVDTAKTAARSQTLGVVIDSLAKANNLNRDSVRAQVIEVKKLGIATIQAREIIAKMIVAQLDLRKSSELARLSQNAATIAAIDSSEAFAGIIDGILTRQIRVLRTYGINVTFADKFTAASKRLGHALSAQEKSGIALATVLDQLPKLMGTYEAGMTTAGKQMTSLTRHFQEAKIAVGDELIPVLGTMVHLLERAAKAAQDNAKGFSLMIEGGTALGVALGVARFTPGGPIAKTLVGGAAGLLTFAAATSSNPVEYYKDQAARSIGKIRERQVKINERLKSGDIGADAGAAGFKALDESITTIRRQTIELIAQAVKGDWEKYLATQGMNVPAYTAGQIPASVALTQHKAFLEGRGQPPIPKTYTIAGITITRGEVLNQIYAKPPAPSEGPIRNDEAIEFARRAEAAAKAAAEAAKKAEAFARKRLELTKRLAGEIDKYKALVHAAAIGGTGIVVKPDAGVGNAYNDRLGFETRQFQTGLTQSISSDKTAIGNIKKSLEPHRITKMMFMRFKLLRQTTELEARRIELIAGPGGEVAAVEKIMKIRLGFMDKMKKAGFDQFDLDQERMQIITNYEINLLEIRRRGLKEYRQSVVSMFDALIASGQGGFSAFIKSQGLGVARQVVGNLAEQAYKPGLLTLPGQGTASKPNFIGKILSGTPFGLDPATRATDANTLAVIANTKAQLLKTFGGSTAERYTVNGTFQGSSNLPEVIASMVSGKVSKTILPGKVQGMVQGGNINLFNRQIIKNADGTISTVRSMSFEEGGKEILVPTAVGGKIVSDQAAIDAYHKTGKNLGIFRDASSATAYAQRLHEAYASGKIKGVGDSTIDLSGYYDKFGLGKTSGGFSPLKGIGVAGASVAGTFGVLAGIKQGGARGALTAGAAGAGAAGALVAMLAPTTGPLAPVLMGIGLGLGAAAGFLPDPKKHRAEQIDLRIEKAQITVEGPTEFRLTGGGQGFDYNFLNQPRVFVIDNSGGNGSRMSEDEAADLVRGAIQRGHPINDEMRSAVLGI